MDLDDTPPQPDERYEACPEDLMEAVKSIHHTVSKLDRAVTGDRYNPQLRPGLLTRVLKVEERIDNHERECSARRQRERQQEQKRWSLPKKLGLAAIVAAISAAAGAVGSKAVERWVGSSTSEPPSTAHR